MRDRCNPAMITVELGLSLVLVVVVLFVAVGMFSDNLKDVFAHGNFKNMFINGDSKTFFSFFNRDYSSSQIDVQVMGEQGLERIRMRANNNSLDLIGNAEKGGVVQLPTDLANTLAYLNQIINVIVGDRVVCSTMSKESVQKCIAMNLSEKYRVESSGNALTVYDEHGKIVAKGQVMGTDSNSDISFNTKDDAKAKWDKISKISNRFSKYRIDSKYALTVDINYFASQMSRSQVVAKPKVEDDLIALLSELDDNLDNAHQQCKGLDSLKKICRPRIGEDDYEDFQDFKKEIMAMLKTQAKEADNYTRVYAAPKPSVAYFPKGYQDSGLIAQSGAQNHQMFKSMINTNAGLTPGSLPKTAGKLIAGSENALYACRDTSYGYGESRGDRLDTRQSLEMYYVDDCGGGGGGGGSYSAPAETVVEDPAYPLDAVGNCTGGKCEIKDSNNSSSLYVFSESYLTAPSNKTDDPRLAKVSNLSARAEIMIRYSDMVDALWLSATGRKIIKKLKDDQINEPSSCSVFKNGLQKIAKERGLTSEQQKIISNWSRTECGYK